MKRRLTLAILGTVAAALLLAGVSTLLLARLGARKATEDDLRSQAESTANLVELGMSSYGALSEENLHAIQLLVCDREPAANASQANRDQLRGLQLAVCTASSDVAIAEAERQLCDEPPARLDQMLTPDMRAARDKFCKEPSQATLDALRGAYCQAANATTTVAPDAVARRRAEQISRSLCRLVQNRNESRQGLQDTLSKESIDLIVFTPDNQVAEGTIPGSLSGSDLQPDRLRAGETVSGPLGNGFFAASPVDPNAKTLQVIVVSRPSDPVRGLIPWFLLASGITLAIGAIVAASLSRALTNPLREATIVTAKIADGDLSSRLPEHTVRPGKPKDELDELAHSINAMAETLERSRGLERQFLLSVSHDLRTPLTSIRGYAEAIADGAAPDATGAASIILAESRRLERLVKDLLDLAKLDARQFTLHVSEVDLVEIATDSVDGFRREVEAAGLTIHLTQEGGPIRAFADTDRLQQVIANLIENALKFAATTITVSVLADGAGPRIEVADDGPGIAPEDLPHVFERLYVTPARPRRKEAGSGLGLAIVRELIEFMGGRVRAEANPSGGTRMVVTLPTTAPPQPPALPPDPAPH